MKGVRLPEGFFFYVSGISAFGYARELSKLLLNSYKRGKTRNLG
jgi:hypothetical protein